MVGATLLVFPKLILDLSGFETGVVVMPLVKGDKTNNEKHPTGHIRNTHKLLTTAALVMSVLLLTSSLVTTMLIPPEAFQPAATDHPAGDAPCILFFSLLVLARCGQFLYHPLHLCPVGGEGFVERVLRQEADFGLSGRDV